jgi:GlpG protein
MRQIGTLPTQSNAEKFAAYLVTRGIHASIEDEDGAWAVWVREEDRLDEARREMEEFTSNPQDGKYREAVRQANAVLQEEAKRREQARKRQINMRDRWGRSRGSRTPLVTAVILVCVIIFLLTIGGGQAAKLQSKLTFSDVSKARSRGNYVQISDRLIDIRQGQVWRLVTPVLLHGGIWHLAFNMIMLYYLGTPIEQRKGAARLAGLMLTIAVVSTAVQALAPSDWGPFSGSPYVVGMSGVVYGLLGYLWMKGLHQPEEGLWVNPGTLMFLLIWMFLGFAGVLDLLLGARVANLAHGAGLLTGMAVAYTAAALHGGGKLH